MKQLFSLLLIMVLFACGSKGNENFLRDFYQLPYEAVQVIEWRYTTRHVNAPTLPDSLTSDNREFKFNDNHLVKIIAFDSLFQVRCNTDIIYSGDSLLITEHQRDADFVIDITQRENDVVFTKTDQRGHSLIETVTMKYDSTMDSSNTLKSCISRFEIYPADPTNEEVSGSNQRLFYFKMVSFPASEFSEIKFYN